MHQLRRPVAVVAFPKGVTQLRRGDRAALHLGHQVVDQLGELAPVDDALRTVGVGGVLDRLEQDALERPTVLAVDAADPLLDPRQDGNGRLQPGLALFALGKCAAVARRLDRDAVGFELQVQLLAGVVQVHAVARDLDRPVALGQVPQGLDRIVQHVQLAERQRVHGLGVVGGLFDHRHHCVVGGRVVLAHGLHVLARLLAGGGLDAVGREHGARGVHDVGVAALLDDLVVLAPDDPGEELADAHALGLGGQQLFHRSVVQQLVALGLGGLLGLAGCGGLGPFARGPALRRGVAPHSALDVAQRGPVDHVGREALGGPHQHADGDLAAGGVHLPGVLPACQHVGLAAQLGGQGLRPCLVVHGFVGSGLDRALVDQLAVLLQHPALGQALDRIPAVAEGLDGLHHRLDGLVAEAVRDRGHVGVVRVCLAQRPGVGPVPLDHGHLDLGVHLALGALDEATLGQALQLLAGLGLLGRHHLLLDGRARGVLGRLALGLPLAAPAFQLDVHGQCVERFLRAHLRGLVDLHRGLGDDILADFLGLFLQLGDDLVARGDRPLEHGHRALAQCVRCVGRCGVVRHQARDLLRLGDLLVGGQHPVHHPADVVVQRHAGSARLVGQELLDRAVGRRQPGREPAHHRRQLFARGLALHHVLLDAFSPALVVLPLLVQRHAAPGGQVGHAKPLQDLGHVVGDLRRRAWLAGHVGHYLQEEVPGLVEPGGQVRVGVEHQLQGVRVERAPGLLAQDARVVGVERAVVADGGLDLLRLEGDGQGLALVSEHHTVMAAAFGEFHDRVAVVVKVVCQRNPLLVDFNGGVGVEGVGIRFERQWFLDRQIDRHDVRPGARLIAFLDAHPCRSELAFGVSVARRAGRAAGEEKPFLVHAKVVADVVGVEGVKVLVGAVIHHQRLAVGVDHLALVEPRIELRGLRLVGGLLRRAWGERAPGLLAQDARVVDIEGAVVAGGGLDVGRIPHCDRVLEHRVVYAAPAVRSCCLFGPRPPMLVDVLRPLPIGEVAPPGVDLHHLALVVPRRRFSAVPEVDRRAQRPVLAAAEHFNLGPARRAVVKDHRGAGPVDHGRVLAGFAEPGLKRGGVHADWLACVQHLAGA